MTEGDHKAQEVFSQMTREQELVSITERVRITQERIRIMQERVKELVIENIELRKKNEEQLFKLLSLYEERNND